MIENLKELLGSFDEQHVKQGIELLLNLDLEEKEIEQAFGSSLNYSKPEILKWSKKRFEEVFCGIKDNRALLEVSFLVLLKRSGRLKKKEMSLVLNPNPYFGEFDLLNRCFDGVDRLELNEFKWEQTKQILESNPQVKMLKLSGRPMINWSEGMEILSKQLDRLSLSWMNIKDFFNEDRYDLLLPLLEKGMEGGPEILKVETIESMLKEYKIDLGEEKGRWLGVLQKMDFDLNREVNGVLFKMIYCPAGRSKLGAEDIEFEIPKAFWMGQTPVTQELWEAVMGNNPSCFKGIQLPVEQVSWFDSVRFCNKLSELEGLTPAYTIGSGDQPVVEWNTEASGYRLPSQHEWEMAARAGTDFQYAGSDYLDEVGWYFENSSDETHPVAQKKPNEWGLYDMSGNVDEWCNSLYGDITEDPYAYRSLPIARSVRGGRWNFFASHCRIAYCSGYSPYNRWNYLSLRLLKPMCIG